MNATELKQGIEPTVQAFINLGFPKYESQVLAILSAIGTATIKDIHKYTDVPLPKVYQTIENLLRRELVIQHTKTRPVQYTAFSPQIIIRKIQESNRNLEDKLKSGLDHLSDLKTPSFTGEIYPFSGLDDFLRIGRSLILNVKKVLSIAMGTETLKLFEREINQIKEKGIIVRSLSFKQLALIAPSMKPKAFKDLGIDHFTVDVPLNLNPSLKFFNVIRKLGSVLDYLGIIISDSGESVLILPLFPHETYFGIWFSSEQIVRRQLAGYDELFKIATKT
ncbi:MAG TPA: helix-turn-helix domain-containing protein [Candidatus Bathyarchaeia archaeon]|nr:helix-turn-helix domain-containing protein [Candidatus Bathyarchaeia archaeon]